MPTNNRLNLTWNGNLGFTLQDNRVLGNQLNLSLNDLTDTNQYQWVIKENKTDLDANALSANTFTLSGETSKELNIDLPRATFSVSTTYYFALQNVTTGQEGIQISFIIDQDAVLSDTTTAVNQLASLGYLDFEAQSPAVSYLAGRLYYDQATDSLSFYDSISGTSIQLGKEQVIDVRNNTGSQINNGQVVYLSGSIGQKPTIALAQADDIATCQIIGVATHDIANNTNGKVTISGLVNGLDTSSFSDGVTVYLSSTVAGGLTSTPPASPNYVVEVGHIVYSNASNGILLIHTNQTLGNNNSLGTSQEVAPTQNAVKTYVDNAVHDPVTVTDSSEIDFTLTGQNITASIIAGSIDETKLDASTNASLDLADNSVQKVASTDNAIARFDGTGGAIQNTGITIDDNNTITLTQSNNVDGIVVNKTGTGTGDGIDIDDAGTGNSIDVNKTNANGYAIRSTQANLTGSYISNSSVLGNDSGALRVSNSANITGINSAPVLVDDTGTHARNTVLIRRFNGTGSALRVQQEGTGSTGIALSVLQNQNDNAVLVTQNGSGNSFVLDQNTNAIALVIDSEATTQPSIDIDQTVSDTANSLTIKHSGVEKMAVQRVDATNEDVCIKLGSYYLWVDSTGDLRIKSGVPTTDTDGTVVGTQT